MRRNLVLASFLTFLYAASGCTNGKVAPLSPSVAPSYQPPSATTTAVFSDSGIEVEGGALSVALSANSQPVPGALVEVYGPTLAYITSQADGLATFDEPSPAPGSVQSPLPYGPLVEASNYQITISAPGYATVPLGNIAVVKHQLTTITQPLQPGTTVTGTITANGQPAQGAVISDGINSALSDAQGNYQLTGVSQGAVTLSASKSRFQTASLTLTPTGAPVPGKNFQLAQAAPVAYFDPTVASGVPLSKFSHLQAHLVADGWKLTTTQPGAAGNAWVIMAPSQPLPASTLSQIVNFVAAGGKLIMFGEWGGYSGFNNPAANALAHQLGLHFNPDLLRDPAAPHNGEWLSINAFKPAPSPVSGIGALKLFSACSVFGLPSAVPLAQSAPASYRVQDNAPTGLQTVAFGGPYKGGKAVALGDSSAWSDNDTDGSGAANVDKADNTRFIVQLFDW